mgnify:CR=1 FL=1
MTSSYNIVASTNQSTVVAEYTPEERVATAYQSEAELENEDGYEEHLETRPDITHDVNCIFNREQIETHLNENMIIDTIGNKEDVPGAINYGLYAIVKENLE